MANNLEKIKARLAQLISQGEEILREGDGEYVDLAGFEQWRLSCLSFLAQVYTNNSLQMSQFTDSVRIRYAESVSLGLAVLKSVSEELQFGALGNLEDLVSGEIFTDFLEMASYLQEQGYKDPAASLAGAVLEDGLKRLAKKNDIRLSNRDDISSVNSKLAAKPIYNRIVQREVEVWAAIRNHADHHHFDQYSEQQVKAMLDGVQAFLGRFL